MPYIIDTSFDQKYSIKAAPMPDDPLYLYRKENYLVPGNYGAKNGVPLPEHIVPKGFYSKSKQKWVPDFFHMFSELVVSEKFKDLIESFEPGEHQFFPINGYHPQTGDAMTLHCYNFNCCNLVQKSFVEPQEGVSIEQVNPKIRDPEFKGDRRLYFDTSAECTTENWIYQISRHSGGFFLRPEIIGNKHIWIEQHFVPSIFISDEFHAALVEHDIRAALDIRARFFPLAGKDYGGAV